MNIYETCPSYENEKYELRLVTSADAQDLLKVYSDTKAVPFFNSDNCHGDDFHYTTMERMQQAVDFWIFSYKNGYFVRWTIVDKTSGEAVGSIEEFLRNENDYFTDCGLLRLDLRSDYERAEEIAEILSLIAPPSFEIFGCKQVATKAIPAAEERIRALKLCGFIATDEKLVGQDGTEYGDYYVLKK